MIIFHHNDLDGRCAAAILYHSYPDAQIIEVDYNQPFPFQLVEKGQQIYIVDFNLTLNDWKTLLNITTDIIWIDHHDTSLQPIYIVSAPSPSTLQGIRSKDMSGAGLTWQYLTDEPAPLFIKYVSDYDTWTHQYPESILFMYGMTAENQHPTSSIWKLLYKNTDTIINNGKIIQQSYNNQNKYYIQLFGFESQWLGHNCFCCNSGLRNSTLFDSLNKEYDILIPFCFNGDNWSVSLYSKIIDCSLIAKTHGGGGHKHAAGFSCNRLPFRKCR